MAVVMLAARAAKCPAASLPDLNEDQRSSFPADKIDFPAATTVVACDQRQVLPREVVGREVFAALSKSGRGIVAAHRSSTENDRRIPALYVVPTPLGNLSDMTPRGVEVLRQVGWIACEDTRHSAPLLRHFGIEARLLAPRTNTTRKVRHNKSFPA